MDAKRAINISPSLCGRERCLRRPPRDAYEQCVPSLTWHKRYAEHGRKFLRDELRVVETAPSKPLVVERYRGDGKPGERIGARKILQDGLGQQPSERRRDFFHELIFQRVDGRLENRMMVRSGSNEIAHARNGLTPNTYLCAGDARMTSGTMRFLGARKGTAAGPAKKRTIEKPAARNAERGEEAFRKSAQECVEKHGYPEAPLVWYDISKAIRVSSKF